MSTTDELLTVEDVARVCRIHEVTVRRHIASGRLPSVRVGRGVRVRRGDLDAYLEPAAAPAGGVEIIKEGGPFTKDDALWNIVGMIEDDEPWISGDKYCALAEAYEAER